MGIPKEVSLENVRLAIRQLQRCIQRVRRDGRGPDEALAGNCAGEEQFSRQIRKKNYLRRTLELYRQYPYRNRRFSSKNRTIHDFRLRIAQCA